MDHVKKSGFKGSNFTDDELHLVLKIANFLRRFVPRRWKGTNDKDYRQHTPHIVLDAPLVVISNAILRLFGRYQFTRRIAPMLRQATCMGCNSEPHNCSMCSVHRVLDITTLLVHGEISNVQNVVNPRHNKQMVFKGFFDTGKIDTICRKHGLQFGQRMIYVDRHTLHLSGPQVQDCANRHSVKSAYEIRRKATRGRPDVGRWRQEFSSSGLTREQIESKIEEESLEVDAKMMAREGPRNRVARLRRECSTGNSNAKNCEQESKMVMMSQLKVTQHCLRQEELLFNTLDSEWEGSKKELNYWNRMLTGAKSKVNKNTTNPETFTIPTWQLPCAEDTPQHLDLREVFSNHLTTSPRHRTRVVATWTLASRQCRSNVFLTMEGITESINRFHVLQDLDEEAIDEPKPWTPQQREEAREQVEKLKIPKAHRVTAQQVNEVSFGRRLRNTREQLLMEDRYIGAKTDVSLAAASTLEEVTAAFEARVPVINDIRNFNKDSSLIKLRRTTRHRTTTTWARLASNLRSKAVDYMIERLTPQERGVACVDSSTGFCSECKTYEVGKCRSSGHYHHPTHCVHTVSEVRYVGFIGSSGTGVGSRLKGNFRLGGQRIREQHKQFGTVIMTDEYMSSQRCCFCFRKTRPGQSRRIFDGTQKVVNLHGVKEYSNPTCPAFRIGYTTRPRDTQACVCIGMSGFSALNLGDRRGRT